MTPTMPTVSRIVWVLAMCVGCGELPAATGADASLDGGFSAVGSNDAGTVDSGSRDSGVRDGGFFDSGVFDAGAADASVLGAVDSGARDAGRPDARVPDSGVMNRPDGGVTYSLNFATATIENPLSAGGVWTNNTQGTGGNEAPGNLTSLRVDLASDGVTRIAFDTHPGLDYDDSFAFVPGFSGDQYVEAVIYKEPGYNANASGANHELELLLGCSSVAGARTWNEFLMNSGGGVDIVYLSGGPADFQSISNVSGVSAIPVDGDVVRATRVGNVLSLYLNGALWARYDGSNPALVAKGSGIGLAGFIRPGATHNKYGFRQVTMGSR